MNILLGVTGSVASILTLNLVKALAERKNNVKIIATESAKYFLKEKNQISALEKMGIKIIKGKDEWPGKHYTRNQLIPHIELGKWADLFLIAPITAHTISQIAIGSAGNLLLSTVLAYPTNKKLIIAPAMNTIMWEKNAVKRNLNLIREDYNLVIVEPIVKKLACGGYGQGAMASIENIVKHIF